MMMAARTMPHAKASEQGVLGRIIVQPDWLPYVELRLQPEDFYLDAHRTIYGALRGLKHDAIDVQALVDLLRAQGQLDAVGGTAYLSSLLDADPVTDRSAEEAVARVAAVRRVRALIAAAREVAAEGYGERASDVDGYIEWAESTLYSAIHDGTSPPSIQSLAAALSETMREIESAAERGEGLTGVPTDFSALDGLTGGWQRKTLTILGARPRMGKSALAGAWAWRAGRARVPTLFASLEMSQSELVRRMLSAKAGVNNRDVQCATLEPWQWERLHSAAMRLSDAPVWLCDEPEMTIERLRSIARLWKVKHELGLLIVDYLQLLKPRKRQQMREREIAEISAGLKSMARELDIPVIALCQLNRELEKRPNKRPMLSDLRDSGAIEQDADLVIFLHREEVFDANTTDRGIAEVSVAKHRNGPTGGMSLRWDAELTRFSELAVEENRRSEQQSLGY